MDAVHLCIHLHTSVVTMHICVCVSLQRIQRKTLDVLNSVGLGDTMLRLIERRQRMDIWVTYGGMVSTHGHLCDVWRHGKEGS